MNLWILKEKTSGSKSICSSHLMPPWLPDSGGWAIPVTLAGWSSSCSQLSWVWVLVWAYLLLILSTWRCLCGTLFISCSFVTSLHSYSFSFFVLFLMVQKNAYVWYYFLCRVVSVRVFWQKELWTWVAWVWGVRWCNQLLHWIFPHR